jgi:putative oxidoreductase
MKIMVIICRVLLGAAFIVFGLNIIHPFMPMPPMPEDSLPARFGAVMAPSHWMALIGVFQLVGGLLVILGRTTPMGLVLLGPVLVNIVAFHVFLENGKGLVPGLVFCALELFLIYAYRSYFLPIFTLNARYDKKP